MPGLSFGDRLHFLHRAWRYRLRSERAELAYMRSLDLRGRVCVDVGAHRGIYSYWMARAVGPSGRVIAFEPQPDVCNELRQMKQTFGLKNLVIVEAGLSGTSGTCILRRRDTHSGGASLEPGSAEAEGATTSFTVGVTTLDEWLAANVPGRVSFIKCDVEGHEREVFRGARRTLERDRPVLLFECHDKPAMEGAVFGDLQSLGYRGWFLVGSRRVPVERLGEERANAGRPYFNYVFEPGNPVA